MTRPGESALMVDIAHGAVANRFVSGYDAIRAVLGLERMIGPYLHSQRLHSAFDWKGTHP
ncbi:MAG: hypothetical protein ABSC37_07595 [Xanthobacteraceae bacterium]